MSDAMIEEAIEESFDWLERGGWRRISMVFKVVAWTIAALIGALVLFLIEAANYSSQPCRQP